MSRSKRAVCLVLACLMTCSAVLAEEPEVTAAPTMEVTPAVTAEVTPAPDPTAAAGETPTAEPESTSQPESTPTIAPTQAPESTPAVEPTPTAEPKPTVEPVPTAEPVPTIAPEPTTTPEPTTAPTATPVPAASIEIKLSGNAQLVDGVWQVFYQTPEEQVTFEWPPVEQAVGYEVQIVDDKGQVVYTSTEAAAAIPMQDIVQPAEEAANPAQNIKLSIPVTAFGTAVYTIDVKAIKDQQILAKGQLRFALTMGEGGFPGGGFPGGGFPGGGSFGGGRPSGSMNAGGMPEEEQGFRITPGEAFANSHSSGSKDMLLYGSVGLAADEEAMTVLTLDDTQLDVSLDEQTRSFFAVIDEGCLLLTPESEGKMWSVNALALKTLRRSGIEGIVLMLGDESIALSTDLQLQGAENGRLSAQGYVSKDYTLAVAQDEINVMVAGWSYLLDENNELVGGE